MAEPDRSDDVFLDGSVAPDPQAVRQAWKDTVDAPERIQEDNGKVFRKVSGVSSPSSIVGSAEGATQFAGLYEDGNGLLSVVARQALQDGGLEGLDASLSWRAPKRDAESD